MGLLTLLLIIPIPAMLLVLFLPGERVELIRSITLGTTLLQLIAFFALVLPTYLSQQAENGPGYQLEELQDWILVGLGSSGALRIEYHLALDGLSMMMVMLSVIILPIATLSSYKIKTRVKTYFVLFLLLDITVLGSFMALDFFLFYIFFEFMLVPMFFLIGLWGGPRREYASIKFFLYTLFGSVFMLLVMIGLAFSFVDPAETAVLAGFVSSDELVNADVIMQVQNQLSQGLIDPSLHVHSFNMRFMMEAGADGSLLNAIPGSIFWQGDLLLGLNPRHLAFLVMFISFAIKVPSVPLHTWLPDAHVEAPTPVSVILAGLLLKIGGYGVLRICFGLFPDGGFEFSGLVAWMGVISILYGAFLAMTQKDLKRLIAFSSISHMGFVLLGISSLDPSGVDGAVLQMFNHGLVSSALFILVGVLDDRMRDRTIRNYSGLWLKMPQYTVMVMITFFASMGMPGLNSFVSEVLALVGSFTGDVLPKFLPALAVTGILFAAVYYLRTFRAMFFGEFAYTGPGEHGGPEQLKDLKAREYIMVVPLVFGMVLLGIFPGLLLNLCDQSLALFTENINLVADGVAAGLSDTGSNSLNMVPPN